MSRYIDKHHFMLNARMPSQAAARLSRTLQAKGMTPMRQASYTLGQADVVDLQTRALLLGVRLTRGEGEHAISEWRACFLALPAEFRAEVQVEFARVVARDELDVDRGVSA